MNTQDKLNAKDGCGAALVAASSMADALMIAGHYSAELVRNGAVIWHDDFPNLVTTPGKNKMLDDWLAGSAFTQTGPFMGLVTGNSFTASMSGTVMTVTAVGSGVTLGIGQTIYGAGIAANTTITSLGTGTGGTGTYNINNSQTVSSESMWSSASTVSILAADTMASHAGWAEAGAANLPTYTAPRKTCAWSAASVGSKALSATLSFVFTSSGQVKGAFLVLESGALSTIDNTAGTLFSAGTFSGGDRQVQSGDTLNVSYSLSL